MSYSQVETTMQSILAGVAGLSSATVTLGDDGVLDRGITACAIIEAGGMEVTPVRGSLSDLTYQCRVAFFVRYTTRPLTHAAIVTLRDAVVKELQNYFPDGVKQAANPYGLWVEGIAADGSPQDIAMQNSPNTGPVFRAQTLIITVKQTAPYYK